MRRAPCFGMRGSGPLIETMQGLIRAACARAGMDPSPPALSTAAFRRPEVRGQLRLFD